MTTISPVIVGLVIGTAFVVLLAVMFPMAVNIAAQNSFMTAIEGLKKSYSVREQIDFTVKVK